MIELGELEAHQADFAARNARLVVVSTDGLDDARKTKERFPHLTVLSDEDRILSTTANVIGTQNGPDGKPVVAPTTFFIDGQGVVQGIYRADRYLTRLSPEEVAALVDKYMPATQ